MLILAVAALSLVCLAAALFLLCLALTVLDAYRQSPAQALLCLFLPPYGVYFLLARSENQLRGPLALGLVLSPAAILFLLGAAFVLFAESSPVLPFVYA